MAGDWIKIEMATPDKPEVFRMAELLEIDPDAVVGKLVRFWSWCDSQSVDGNAIPVTTSYLDRLTHQPGFSDALRKVGWLEVRSGSLQVPRFDRHNGQSAKARAESNRRVSKHRTGKRNGESVTNVTPEALQKPLPEKRREEEKEERERKPAGGIRRPTLEQAKAAASNMGIPPMKADEWWHAREASEWMKGMAGGGTSPVGSNWQADLKTYATRGSMNPGHNGHATGRSKKELTGADISL